MTTPIALPDLPDFGDDLSLNAVAGFHDLIAELADRRRVASDGDTSPFSRAHASGWIAGAEATLDAASAATSPRSSMRAQAGQRHATLRGRLVAATETSRRPGDILRRASEAGFLAGANATRRALMALVDARIVDAAERGVDPR